MSTFSFFSERKTQYPIVLGEFSSYEKLKEEYNLIIFTQHLEEEEVHRILRGEQSVTINFFLAIVSAVNLQLTRGIYYPYLVNCTFSNPRLMKMMLSNPKNVKFDEDIKDVVAEDKEEIEEKQILVTREADRSEASTYIQNAAQYVAEAYDRRVQDVFRMLDIYRRAYNIATVVAPNDGAGVVCEAARRLGIESYSADSIFQMVEEAKKKLNEVELCDAFVFLKKYPKFPVIISHSEQFQPGVVLEALKEERDVIVFETSEVFLGRARLRNNAPGWYSTYSIKIPFASSIMPAKPFLSSWYKIARYGVRYAVSDWKCIPQLSVLQVMKVPVYVYTMNYRVYEMCVQYGFFVTDKRRGDEVGIYIDRIEYPCQMYFSVREGRFHRPFGPLSKWKEYQYVYAQRGNYEIQFYNGYFCRLRGNYEGTLGDNLYRLSTMNYILNDKRISALKPTLEEEEHELGVPSTSKKKGFYKEKDSLWYPWYEWWPVENIPPWYRGGVGLWQSVSNPKLYLKPEANIFLELYECRIKGRIVPFYNEEEYVFPQVYEEEGTFYGNYKVKGPYRDSIREYLQHTVIKDLSSVIQQKENKKKFVRKPEI